MMAADDERRRDLADSWRFNADRWTTAVRSGTIASRRLCTDRAIIEAVLARHPASLLDLGCGEGWLCRALAGQIARIVGLDASPELIASALEQGGAQFVCGDFASLAAGRLPIGGPFDLAVANFALLDDRLPELLTAVRRLLAPGGALIIQTLHPFTVAPPYQSGWRSEDFSAFGEARWQAMPWYFRTLSDWIACFGPDWRLSHLAEPLHPETQRPASLLIVAEPMAGQVW